MFNLFFSLTLYYFIPFICRMENDKLKQMLKQKDDEVVQTRATLERFANAVSSYAANSLNATPTY